ncbi:MAG: hypothetical protein H6518_05860 [Microthrixaceae bacterium]|nr:hypothetical protein [Microthrixaceae bacterium]
MGYIVAIGVATYLMKVARGPTAFQINLLMGIAMVAISLPAVLLAARRAPRSPSRSALSRAATGRKGRAAAGAHRGGWVSPTPSWQCGPPQRIGVGVAGVGLTLGGVALLSFRT